MNLEIKEIKKRIQPKDFICIIGGLAQKPVSDAFPQNIAVEYGIGYSGVFSNYKVFESYAWKHAIYAQHRNAAAQGLRPPDAQRQTQTYRQKEASGLAQQAGISDALQFAKQTDEHLACTRYAATPFFSMVWS